MKKSLIIALGLVFCLGMGACSKKTSETLLPPDCNKACQAYYEIIEELAPVNCKDFDGVQRNLCHLYIHDLFRSALQKIENNKYIVDKEKLEKSGYTQSFDTCFYDELSKNDLEEEILSLLEESLNKITKHLEAAPKVLPMITEAMGLYEQCGSLIAKASQEKMNDHQKYKLFKDETGKSPDQLENYLNTKEKKINEELGYFHLKFNDESVFNLALGLALYNAYSILNSKNSKSKKSQKAIDKEYFNQEVDKEFSDQIKSYSSLFFKHLLRAYDYNVDNINKYYSNKEKSEIGFEAIHHIIIRIVMYTIMEKQLPSSNKDLANKIPTINRLKYATPDTIEKRYHLPQEAMDVGYKLSEAYYKSNPYAYYKSYAYYISNPYSEFLRCPEYLITDEMCQSVDFKLKDDVLKLTLVGPDGKLGSGDDVSFDIKKSDILDYIAKYKPTYY